MRASPSPRSEGDAGSGPRQGEAWAAGAQPAPAAPLAEEIPRAAATAEEPPLVPRFPRVSLLQPPDPLPSPPLTRIRLDSNLRRWFSRNLGLWRSRRLYFFRDQEEPMRVDMLLRVESFSEPIEGEAAYRFTWWPEKEYDFFERNPRYVREGVMEAYLCGHQLRRSQGYLCGSPTKSQIRQVDEHELIFESHYQEWDILEHIRLVDQDRYRSRSIYSWRDGDLELSEVHHEIRLEGAGAPLPEPS